MPHFSPDHSSSFTGREPNYHAWPTAILPGVGQPEREGGLRILSLPGMPGHYPPQPPRNQRREGADSRIDNLPRVHEWRAAHALRAIIAACQDGDFGHRPRLDRRTQLYEAGVPAAIAFSAGAHTGDKVARSSVRHLLPEAGTPAAGQADAEEQPRERVSDEELRRIIAGLSALSPVPDIAPMGELETVQVDVPLGEDPVTALVTYATTGHTRSQMSA